MVEIDIDVDWPKKVIRKKELKAKLWRSPDFGDCFIWSTLVLTPKWYVKIENIEIWDLVVTPNWNRKVIDTIKKTTTRVYSLDKRLVWTGKHKIRTSSWLNRLDSITIKDKIQLFNLWSVLKWRWRRLWNTNERSTGYLGNITTINIKIGGPHYIDKNGKMKIDQYQIDTSYTILIEMLQIILLRIFFWWKTVYIVNIICTSTLTILNGLKEIINYLKGLDHLQKNDIDQKNESNDTKNIMMSHCDQPKRTKENVTTVERSIIQLGKRLQDFAHIIVDKIWRIKKKDILKKEFVSDVELLFQYVDQKRQKHVHDLVQLNLDGQINVFDLEIEWDHVYYANDVLVSNCMMMRSYWHIKRSKRVFVFSG